ncbi:toprim domain-containing protein [Actinomadura fibrosa]|uniref:Toprim domain-containing protein n=1 Tax=Actinomadura fibrosa TaxID=111802 RepID=A0ABW2XX70_9ACTN|nr:toprim domain-containing protein [Actinomadura fibrosa]
MTTPSSAEPDERQEEQNRRLEVLRGIAEHEVTRLYEGQSTWTDWLQQASRHGRYGFTNTLLIPAQRRSATDVRSYDEWKKQGRQVIRGEIGIRIITSRGTPRSVFDIEQTEGGEVTDRGAADPADGLRRLSRLAANLDMYVDRGQHWSYLGPPERRIRIPSDLDDAAATQALAHQLAHVLQPGGRVDTADDDLAACYGARRVLADSVAFLGLAELGLPPAELVFSTVQLWAGKDVRANPHAAVRAMGRDVVRLGTQLRRRLSGLRLPGDGGPEGLSRAQAVTRSVLGVDSTPATESSATAARTNADEGGDQLGLAKARLHAVLEDAHRFYRDKLGGSWGERYLASRGFNSAVQERWEVGHAPSGRYGLVHHLRQVGHGDEDIVAAGLARRGRGGQLTDVFRNRALLPLRDGHGAIVGFIGRRLDGAKGPKYLNSPETALFRKSETLFGLYEGRDQLAGGARPVLVEGPLDAIAVDVAAPGPLVAVAPCGTAITTAQIDAIDRHCDIATTGLVLALDGDSAGHKAALRAWTKLSHLTGPVDVGLLPQGRDPADLLNAEGGAAVREALQVLRPLADLVVDETLESVGGEFAFAETRLLAVRAAARLVAGMPSAQAARQVGRISARTGVDLAEVTAAIASAIVPDSATDTSPASEDFPLPVSLNSGAPSGRTAPQPPRGMRRSPSR